MVAGFIKTDHHFFYTEISTLNPHPSLLSLQLHPDSPLGREIIIYAVANDFCPAQA